LNIAAAPPSDFVAPPLAEPLLVPPELALDALSPPA
jgi:hypothetical protein